MRLRNRVVGEDQATTPAAVSVRRRSGRAAPYPQPPPAPTTDVSSTSMGNVMGGLVEPPSEVLENVELREIVVGEGTETPTVDDSNRSAAAPPEEVPTPSAPAAETAPISQEEKNWLRDARKRAERLAQGHLPPRHGYTVDPDTGRIQENGRFGMCNRRRRPIGAAGLIVVLIVSGFLLGKLNFVSIAFEEFLA